MISCTGISATWCPVHGDCRCPRNEEGETVSDNDPDLLCRNSEHCQLHAPWSNHGEQVFAETIWGKVEIGDTP